jgi:hypothetical protein
MIQTPISGIQRNASRQQVNHLVRALLISDCGMTRRQIRKSCLLQVTSHDIFDPQVYLAPSKCGLERAFRIWEAVAGEVNVLGLAQHFRHLCHAGTFTVDGRECRERCDTFRYATKLAVHRNKFLLPMSLRLTYGEKSWFFGSVI